MTKDIADLRITYTRSTLDEREMADSPLAQFAAWFAQAREVIEEPNAMICSTANAAGEVSSRNVLLKGVESRGFLFFTNYNSRKARDIAENPNVSLLFSWYELHRQVTISGLAERVSRAETEEYFRSRPHLSQIGAWASPQSERIADRSELEHRYIDYLGKWPEGSEVPVPEHWGGFLVRASTVEFWAGRANRLHDRLRYTAPGIDAPLDVQWRIERIAP